MRVLILGFAILIFTGACKEQKPKVEKDENKELRVSVYDYPTLAPRLKTESDSTYIFNFWATWCKPCVEELPYFEKINKAYKNKKVKVVLVSLDFSTKLETTLYPFLKKQALGSEVVLLDDPDENSWIEKIDEEWSGALPATLIFNKKQREFYEGSFTFEALEEKVKQFIIN